MGEKPAHAMSVEEVLAFYGSNPETGLNSKEHAAALEKFGANELPEEEVTPLWKLILEQFEDLVVIILLVAAAVSFGLALLEDSEDQLQAFFEPAVILIILFVNAFIGVMQESNAEAAIRALKAYEPDHATVVRNGKEARVEASTVVPGDIVHVAVGDKIPADLRLLSITSTTLRCDQALLTGEAYSVGKVTEAVTLDGAVNQDKINILFSGTAVTNGSAVCVAVGTGSNTAIGDIQLTLMDTETTLSPMKVKLDEFGELLAKVILYICIAVWIINIGHFSDPAHGGWVKGAIYYFKIAVALAVAAIPEGLPAVVTTCLALGTKRMAAKNAIVRSLPSVETLGCTTVICSDKTGTLTTNKMSVKKVVTFGSSGELVIREVEGTTYSPVGAVTLLSEEESEETGETIYNSVVEDHPSGSSVSLSQFCTVMSLCNGSNVIGNDSTGEFEIIGEPTEAALRVLTEKCGTSTVSPLEFESSPASVRATAIHDSLLSQYSTKATLEFTRDRKSMSVVVSTDRDEHHLFVKGAPENIVERCSSVFLEGQIVPLTTEKRAEFLTKVKELGTGADTLRVLAGAMVPNCGTVESMDLSAPENFIEYESEMVLIGCAGMLDPPRMEVAPAIAECHGAGIRVMVITGDNKDTAIAIARRIGVFSAEENTEGLAFTGREFDALSKAEKIEAVSRAKLFARVEPTHKSEIVKILMQDLGEVAAMTGDGVNDAPALKAANIGIAMGSGTEVAKGASDMVLADDNFTTIVSAVAEGRAIFNNTTAFIRYLVSSNIGEVASIFITAAVGMPEALVPVQLLWVNLVTDGLPATALGFNPNDDDIMKKPPRKNDEPMIDTWMFIRYMVVGTYVGISTVLGFAWWYMWYAEGPQMAWSDLSNFHSCVEVAGRGWGCDVFDLANGSTISLTILVVCETMNAFNAISANQSLLKTGIFANWYLVGASIISLALHFMILYVDFFNDIFSIVPLNWAEWQAVLWFSLPVVFLDEFAKCFARRRLAATKKLEKKMA